MQRWANDDLRSLNAQIEFVLRDALRRAGRAPRPAGRTPQAGASDRRPGTGTPEGLIELSGSVSIQKGVPMHTPAAAAPLPPPAEVGRRQAPAASGPWPSLPGPVRPLYRAVRRQRRRVLRPAGRGAAAGQGGPPGGREPGSDRLLPDAARRHRRGHATPWRGWNASTARAATTATTTCGTAASTRGARRRPAGMAEERERWPSPTARPWRRC